MDKIRGKRLDIVMIDEAAYVPKPIIEKVVTPMLIVKKGFKVLTSRELIYAEKFGIKEDDKKKEEVVANKILMTSTANYRFNHLYKTFMDWFDQMVKPDNKKYFAVSVPYTVGLRAGLFDEDIVAKQKREMSDTEFEMEYLGSFPRLVEDAWINYESLIQCGDLEHIELSGKDGFEYIMTCDVARMEGKDNTICKVYKLHWYKEHVEIDEVYSVAMNGKSFSEQAKEYRRVLRKFPQVIRVFQDTLTIGQGLTDELAKDFYCDEEDTWYPPLIDMNDESAMAKIDETKAIPLIYGIKGSPDVNHRMGYAVKNFVEKGWLHMYSDHTDENKYLNMEEQSLIDEADYTCKEIMNISTKQLSGGFISFYAKSGRKDRWSTTCMACYGAEIIRKERQEDDDINECLISVIRR